MTSNPMNLTLPELQSLVIVNANTAAQALQRENADLNQVVLFLQRALALAVEIEAQLKQAANQEAPKE